MVSCCIFATSKTQKHNTMNKQLTTDDFLTLEDIQSVNYEDNIERYGDHSCTCIVCGKPTTEHYHIELTTNSRIAPMGTSEEQLAALNMESMGCFPIGTNCAKKIGKQYLIIDMTRYE